MKSTEEKLAQKDAAREEALTQKVHDERARHAEVEANEISAKKIAKSYDRVTAAKTALREHFAEVAARRDADA
jgi:hypothetical protein